MAAGLSQQFESAEVAIVAAKQILDGNQDRFVSIDRTLLGSLIKHAEPDEGAQRDLIFFQEVDADRVNRIKEAFGIPGMLMSKLLLGLYETKLTYYSKDGLYDLLYGDRFNGPERKIIDVHVSKIRSHIGYETIETIWGVGYRLTSHGRALITEALGG
jgi:hypothetical protein